MTSRYSSVADYCGFLARRWRFIAVGTFGVMALMAVVTAVLPRVYSAWAVVDAGTLGERFGLDGYRNHFNDSQSREAVADLPPGAVRKEWMLFARPNVIIRVDAVDGETAALAAKRLAEHTVAELGTLAVPPAQPWASDEQVSAIRHSIAQLRARVDELIARDNDTIAKLSGDSDRLIATMKELTSARIPVTADRWVILVDGLSKTTRTRESVEEETRALDRSRQQLQASLDLPISPDVVSALSDRFDPAAVSAADVVARVTDIQRVFKSTVAAVTPVAGVRIAKMPVVPGAPSWPNPAANLIIAFIFGLVGSTFAAVLAEKDA